MSVVINESNINLFVMDELCLCSCIALVLFRVAKGAERSDSIIVGAETIETEHDFVVGYQVHAQYRCC